MKTENAEHRIHERVGIFHDTSLRYPETPPFHPSEDYPECPFPQRAVKPNGVYGAVRDTFKLLGLDQEHYGTPEWNPLGIAVHPGDHVLIKPNFVRHFAEPGGDINALVTHGSVIRAVLDYVVIALKGKGRITLADAPNNDGHFPEIVRLSRLDGVVDFYAVTDFPLQLVDIHREWVVKREGIIAEIHHLEGDPLGYRAVDLGTASYFADVPHLYGKLRGADYDMDETLRHHNEQVNEYLVSASVLDADVVINMPKMKTHKKTGVTLSMKNLVGINGDKNWLPHHSEGTPRQGGDQFADSGLRQRIEHAAVAAFKRRLAKHATPASPLAVTLKRVGKAAFGDTNVSTVRSGNWHGNDTTWRMALDLNKVLRYADRDGALHDTPQRRYISVLDGVIAGDRGGPMQPHRVDAGIVAASLDPTALDLAVTRIMGFDPLRIPVVHRAFDARSYCLTDLEMDAVVIASNDEAWCGNVTALTGSALAMTPHFGWIGSIEWKSVHQAPQRSA